MLRSIVCLFVIGIFMRVEGGWGQKDNSKEIDGKTPVVAEIASQLDACEPPGPEMPEDEKEETDPPVAETDPPVAETEAPETQTDPPETQTDPPETQTDPPSEETEPPKEPGEGGKENDCKNGYKECESQKGLCESSVYGKMMNAVCKLTCEVCIKE